MRIATTLVCVLIAALVDLLINLLASVVEGRVGQDVLGRWTWLLVALIVCGLAVGIWLGRSAPPDASGVRITRLRAYWSRVRARGQGIHLDRIRTVKSDIEVDTRRGETDD